MKLVQICVAFVFFFMLLPQSGEAYVSTKQSAIRLSDDALLFLVTYEFGHDTFAYNMPVIAKRGSESSGVVGYDILSDGKLRTNIGETAAVVLSDAKLENNMYVVPAGESKEFTLVTFLKLPAERSASSTDFALHVSSLPFEIGGKDGVYRSNKLNPSELTEYQTPVVGTNEKVALTMRRK